MVHKALIISGSGSDEKIVKAYQEKLKSFSVDSDWRVASAHRTPAVADERFREFNLSNDYAVGGAVAGYQNAMAPAWAASTKKPVYALQPEVSDFKKLGMDPPDPFKYETELRGVLLMPPGVSVPVVVGIENGALALAKAVALLDGDFENGDEFVCPSEKITVYLEKKRAGLIEADAKAKGG